MKRLFLFLLILILMCGAIAAWIVLGPGTGFDGKSRSLYIASNATTRKAVMDSLVKNKIVTNENAFKFLAARMGYWNKIRPGKYEITSGMGLLEIVRKLRNGQQTPVDLVITKLRTKEDLAKLVGRKFETDSAAMIAFLNSNDSLRNFNTKPELSVVHILPDKYSYYWTASPSMIYKKLFEESQDFWTAERKQKAAAIGLSPAEVYILASIIEEETTHHEEKDTIASVYLNRLAKGMPLQADPTLKFAARQFELKRIAGDILNIESPYNTYQNKGLPPGPICTPSRKTIDAALSPATTTFLYFVAKPGLGGHLFSTTFDEHVQKARDYWKADKERRLQDSIKKAG